MTLHPIPSEYEENFVFFFISVPGQLLALLSWCGSGFSRASIDPDEDPDLESGSGKAKMTSLKEKMKELSSFEERNILSGWLEASPEAWKSFMEPREKI
jgi:hypothetical protein